MDNLEWDFESNELNKWTTKVSDKKSLWEGKAHREGKFVLIQT